MVSQEQAEDYLAREQFLDDQQASRAQDQLDETLADVPKGSD